jgi:hypothetical protein
MSAGKGDTPRPVDGEKYRENYDRIFMKKQKCKIEKRKEDLSDVVVEFGSPQFDKGAEAYLKNRFGIVVKK